MPPPRPSANHPLPILSPPPHVLSLPDMPSTKHASGLDMVGNTPMVDVSNLSPNPDVRILAKMEMQNPIGSDKDRIAK